jgi:V/A-type H+/Na+-transporting ATPase subunit I
MIVPMLKCFVAVSAADRPRLLEALADCQLLHLKPVGGTTAEIDRQLLDRIQRLERAERALGSVPPATEPLADGGGQLPEAEVLADEVLQIQQRSAEATARLTSLHRQLVTVEPWGELELRQFETLQAAGWQLLFCRVPSSLAGNFGGQGGSGQPLRAALAEAGSEPAWVELIGPANGNQQLVGLAFPGELPKLPDWANPLPLPERDAPDLRAEAAGIDAQLAADRHRLHQLVAGRSAVREHLSQLKREAHFGHAAAAGLEAGELFAVQGFVPQSHLDRLRQHLTQAAVPAAVESVPVDEQEQPPTLLEYAWWAKPIEGLLDILGTRPGYRELDLAPFFMVALPLFAAMLIGDAGYGLIFTLVGLLGYRHIAALAGTAKAQLLVVVGVAMFVWGVLTGNFFGITPLELQAAGRFASVEAMTQADGLWARLGRWMMAPAVLWRADADAARQVLIQASFLVGSCHLILARIRKLLALWPDQRFLAELGWCGVLLSMLGIVWMLFIPDRPLMSGSVIVTLLAVGAALIVLFSVPSSNPAIRLGQGLASSILPLISSFSDTMSYIRLMAVGLASYYIASAFNQLGYQIGTLSPWLIPVAAVVVLAAHLMNIALGVIAIFAHGVRLNMLEFSGNAGVQWAGYPYKPFSHTIPQEDL